MKENQLIDKYIKPLVTAKGAVGLNDDAAVLSVSDKHDLVITTDTLIAGVHFFHDDPPDLIAKKALRVNLSDLAAKGANPYAFTLNLSLPKPFNEAFIKAFFQGLKEDIQRYKINLIGGDTTSAPCVMITITAFGLIEKGKIVRRSGAKIGDLIGVTGTIGDAALGLRDRKLGLDNDYVNRYLLPEPRVELAEFIKHYATSSMDISDGLIGDCEKLLKASEKSAILTLEKVPFYKPLSHEEKLLAVTGGDDYEILFTINPKDYKPSDNITLIGEILDGDGLKVLDNGKELSFHLKSFEH